MTSARTASQLTTLPAGTKPDLAVANHDSSSASVLLNKGDGTFADKLDYTVGWHPHSVIAFDLNGDSKPDLAVTSYYTSTVSVLLSTCLP